MKTNAVVDGEFVVINIHYNMIINHEEVVKKYKFTAEDAIELTSQIIDAVSKLEHKQ